MAVTSDPSYVRLAPHLRHGMIVDVEGRSGFRISGNDVQPFPTDGAQRVFARRELKAGRLHPAGRAEFDEAKAGDEDLPDELPHQEHRVKEAAAAASLASSGKVDSNDSTSSEDPEPEPDEEEVEPKKKSAAKKAPAKKKAAAKKK